MSRLDVTFAWNLPMNSSSLLRALNLTAACALSLQAQKAPTPSIRDSSGVRIIEYQTIKTNLPAFIAGAKYLADVGGLRDDPNDEIEAKTGYETAVRYADGRIAVAENNTIRVLNAQGKFVRLLGGRGSGPGEFDQQIGQLCLIRGDTLIAIGTNRRLSVFAPNGDHVRSSALDGYVAGSCGDDGSLVASQPGAIPTPRISNQQYAIASTFVVMRQLTREGRLGDSIGVFASGVGSGFYRVVEDAFSVALDGDRMYADNGERAEIKIYSKRTGKLQSIIRWKDPLVPVTSKMFEEMASAHIPTNVSTQERTKRMQEMMAITPRQFLPAYSGFFVDRAHRLWIRDYWRDATTHFVAPTYTVFAADGTWLGRYDPPKLFPTRRPTVTDAGENFVVIRQTSLDEGVRVAVQSVTLARPVR